MVLLRVRVVRRRHQARRSGAQGEIAAFLSLQRNGRDRENVVTQMQQTKSPLENIIKVSGRKSYKAQANAPAEANHRFAKTQRYWPTDLRGHVFGVDAALTPPPTHTPEVPVGAQKTRL